MRRLTPSLRVELRCKLPGKLHRVTGLLSMETAQYTWTNTWSGNPVWQSVQNWYPVALFHVCFWVTLCVHNIFRFDRRLQEWKLGKWEIVWKHEARTGSTSGEFVSPEHTIWSFPNLYDCWSNDISIRKNLLYFFVI